MFGANAMRVSLMAVALLEALWVQDIGAFGFSTRGRGASPPIVEGHSDLKTDLTAFVTQPAIDHSEIYTEAVSLLNSIQSAPSCNRLAASTLLKCCQSIDGSASYAETSIEQAKSLYAAQLAMCEIVSAGTAIPQQCRPLAPPKVGATHGGLKPSGNAIQDENKPGKSEIAFRHLGQCLQALESRPQWWTSYSNSRQNAVVMCKAAREDIAKDELIGLHKSMVNANAEAHSALSKAVQQAHDGLAEQFKFATAIKEFQQQLSRDLESSSDDSRSYFAKAVKRMEAITSDMISRLMNAVSFAQSNVADLNENIHKSNAEMLNLQKNVGRVFQQAVSGGAELAASQNQEWHRNQALATSLGNTLHSIGETDIRDILGAFTIMHSDLQTSNNMVSQIYQRQSSLDERLANHDQLLSRLHSNAEAIYAAQTKQAETQTRLFDHIQTELYLACGLIANLTSSAAGLHASVENVASKIATMATLSGVTTSILRWGWISLFAFVLYQFSPRYAAFTIAATGLFSLLWASWLPSMFASIPSDIVLIHYASGYQVPLVSILKIAALPIMVITAGAIYYLSPNFRRHLDQVLNVASRLPFRRHPKESECYL